MAIYQWFSGSDNSFGFFAPRVGADGRVIARAYDGEVWKEFIFDKDGSEGSKRVNTMIGSILNDREKELHLAGLSIYIFNKNHKFLVVSLETQFYHLSPLRNNSALSHGWKTIEFKTFTHPKRVRDEYKEDSH